MSTLPVPRPFLKWAGGKSQLANELLRRMPSRFEIYHEPFVGSGALFFRLRRAGQIRQAVLSDLNDELIDAYLAIRDNVEAVIRILSGFPHTKDFYYRIRATDPKTLTLVERAARMIYLNKTGYNGLYRVSREGKFNVPFGQYASPKYVDEENLRAVSRALVNVEILCVPFETVLERAGRGDFAYFDPPYVPVSTTANFTAYHANGFGLSDQERLRDVCVILSERGASVMVSNSDTSITRSLYCSSPFVISEVLANRAINCNGARRGKVTELVITNYLPQHSTQLRLLEQPTAYVLPSAR